MLEITMTSEVPWFRRLSEARNGTPKQTIPQELADAWTEVMTEAVRWFTEPDFTMLPAMDYADLTSDEDVEKRIRGYQAGYDMEFKRRMWAADIGYPQRDFDQNTKRYEFSKLPWSIQRAVVSHWDRLHMEFLKAHGLFYYNDVGYVWLYQDGDEWVKVPHRDSDCGEKPTQEDMARLVGGHRAVVQGPYDTEFNGYFHD